MKSYRAALAALLVGIVALSACQESSPTPGPDILATVAASGPGLTPSAASPAASTTASGSSTPAPQAPTAAAPSTPSNTPAAAGTAYCKNGGAVTVSAGEPLAAKVNGQPIPLALYQRQTAQEQATLVAQGLDINSANGKEALKGLQQQVLGQLIDNALVEQLAKQENVTVTDQDVNSRIQQMIDDAGGRSKFDDWLKSTSTPLDDLCIQIRSSMFGEVMLTRVTANLPTKVEQVHAAQILLATQADANTVLAQLKAGKKFADLAKQYSKDETSRDNGGELGWFPRGMWPPEFEAVAFQLQPGQTSDVVSTALGFHIIQVLGHESARELSPDQLQNQKQQAFLAWLDARRNQAQIERLINP